MGIPFPQNGSVTEDTGVVGGFVTATGDADYVLGNDTGEWTAETIAGQYGTLDIDANGVWTYQAENAQAAIQALNSGDTLTEVFDVSSQGGDTTVTITINGQDEPPCFARGTLIDTPHGPRPVETLVAGDQVLTADNGPQVLKWVGSRRLRFADPLADPKLSPIRVRKGSIAPGVPSADMLVSPMHRILLKGAHAQMFFGQDEVLATAKHLINGQTIFVERVAQVEYFHLLFDEHQILSSLNMLSESFYPGGVGLTAFEPDTREEVLELFPELRSAPDRYGKTARSVLKRYEANLARQVLRPPQRLAGILHARVA